MKIFLVIPAYNEAQRIGAVLERVPKQIGKHSVTTIVVDDGSKDKTSAKAKEYLHVVALRHRINLGKGAAAKTGCDAAFKMGADVIVLMDADGQHRPEDLKDIVTPILEKKTELVLGVRSLDKKMPFPMRFGNKALNFVSKVMFKITASDTQSGFRAFESSSYEKLRWGAANYAMEMEMLILAYHHNLKVEEVEIPTIYLDNYKGTTAVDGLRILKVLLKWKLLWYQEYNSLESSSAWH